MPPTDPAQYIRTLKFTLLWSAAIAGTPEEIRRVYDVLFPTRVRIEREIEDCIDDGLRGKQLDDPNTRVRIDASLDKLHMELNVQVTFASLMPETVEQVMMVAQKVDECAGAVLRSHTKRIDARVMEQHRQVKLVRTPAKVVPVQAGKPAQTTSLVNASAPSQAVTMWLVVNSVIALMALAGVVVLSMLMLLRR